MKIEPVIYPAMTLIAVVMLSAVWAHHTFESCQATLAARDAQVEIYRAALVESSAQAEKAFQQGRVEGYEQALTDHNDVVRESAALQLPVRPTCSPMTPPYEPCCGESAMPGGITESIWPTPDEFKARHDATGRFLTLSCARTVHQKPEQGAPWVCGRTEARCVASKQRAGSCETCYVFMAGGAGMHEDFAWTGHALDEVDGPWTADGKRGVFVP
jgi:hypothetical protein